MQPSASDADADKDVEADGPDRLPLPWQDEVAVVQALHQQLGSQKLGGQIDWAAVRQRCEPWVLGVRRNPGPAWAMESLLHEFPLSSHEGLALMRLAEALLRVPDAETALALTADQLGPHPEFRAGFGEGLHTTAKAGVIQQLSARVFDLARQLLPEADHAPQGWLQRLGGPAVVAATVRSVQLLGRQFVLGQTVGDAIARAQQQQAEAHGRGQRLCHSFDMLGEGARSWADADRYFAAYQHALHTLAGGASRSGTNAGPAPHAQRDGLSIKLSALHPRLEVAHRADVHRRLLPRLHTLALQAAQADVQLTLDAEESWRLELHIEVLDALLHALQAVPQARGWSGLGLAVQAYQLRATAAIDEVARLAHSHQRRLTVRLVKGAYWDSEIKRAQELGLPGFAVFTRKAHTDISYLACAQRLLAHHALLQPQFATHNAATVAAVMELARTHGVEPATLEWQRLHGMGEATWREILADPVWAGPPPTLRIYAPVGAHTDLLAYLVRRLLENGANSSFVHRLVDPAVSLDTLLASPLLAAHGAQVSDVVVPPRQLAGPGRLNAWGRDLHVHAHRAALMQALQAAPATHNCHADSPMPPAADVADINPTMQRLHRAFEPWEATPATTRCALLDTAARQMEDALDTWAADLVLEARKTWPDAVAEVRETIDHLRHAAQQARELLPSRLLPGPTGEHNAWCLRGRGVWVCVAPWNFPLAIFAGQVVAALVMGNTVAAKPAEQTPRIAQRFVTLLHRVGVPADALALLPGPGASVGDALVRHPLTAGVAFTGSVAVAKRIQQALAADAHRPIVPLIAETGGINALIADSTALPEQLLDSVLGSAFGSAGQRCSALRLLCLHQRLAERFEPLLAQAMQTLVVGDPAHWCTDVGPVIDRAAQQRLRAHLDALARLAATPGSGVRLIGQTPVTRPAQPGASGASGVPSDTHIAPAAWALPSVGHLGAEHFGPILHMVAWGPGTAAPSLDELIDQINATGYGLTLGVHTRIDSRAQHIAQRARVGNVYVNRGMTGAVVGMQPFGGQGLSGTGPKAGGPLYLQRFATEQVVCTNTSAAGGNASLMSQAE